MFLNFKVNLVMRGLVDRAIWFIPGLQDKHTNFCSELNPVNLPTQQLLQARPARPYWIIFMPKIAHKSASQMLL
jgi:hypothetical protein